MKIKNITLAAVALASGIAYIFAGETVIAVFLKPVPIAGMVIWLLTQKQRTAYRVWIISALVVSAVADVVFSISFIAGVAVFLGAHIVYIIAFSRDCRTLMPLRAAPVVLYAASLCVIVLRFGELNGMEVPVIVYAAVISIMVWRSACRIGSFPGARWALAGAILFLLSDSLLVLHNFVVTIPHDRLFIMIAYWPGQFGLAYSADNT
ncbi:MAG: lysoplasmalogenase [Spirochaetales bacterium]|nr:lysoplasmalogenase [Spirochaetales bacterium]